EGLLGQRELPGHASEQVPARRQDRVVEAERDDMDQISAEHGGQRRQHGEQRKRHEAETAPVHESKNAAHPSRHSWMSAATRSGGNSRAGPSALMRPRLTM